MSSFENIAGLTDKKSLRRKTYNEKRLPGYAYADFFHSEPPTPFFHLLHCNFQNSSLAINGNSKLEVCNEMTGKDVRVAAYCSNGTFEIICQKNLFAGFKNLYSYRQKILQNHIFTAQLDEIFSDEPYLYDHLIKVVGNKSSDESLSSSNLKTKTKRMPVFSHSPDAYGNYVINSDFSISDFNDEKFGWYLHTESNAAADFTIESNEAVILISNTGNTDHSAGIPVNTIQFAQTGIPLTKDKKYRLSFEAYADKNKSLTVNINSPSNGFTKYFPAKKVNLTVEKQKLEFDFIMKKNTDLLSKIEFDLGGNVSKSPVHI